MGALNGSLTYKTFFVEGDPPADFQDAYLEQISKLAFRDLAPESEDERRMGWVTIEDPLDVEFQRHKVFYNQYIALGLRIDKWSLPSALFKAQFNARVKEYLAAHDLPRISKKQREELQEEVRILLKQRLIPSMKVVDMTWDIHARIVRFWAHSASLGEEFQELFEDTFGLKLIPDSPYSAAQELGLDEEQLKAMLEATPDWFLDMLRR